MVSDGEVPLQVKKNITRRAGPCAVGQVQAFI